MDWPGVDGFACKAGYESRLRQRGCPGRNVEQLFQKCGVSPAVVKVLLVEKRSRIREEGGQHRTSNADSGYCNLSNRSEMGGHQRQPSGLWRGGSVFCKIRNWSVVSIWTPYITETYGQLKTGVSSNGVKFRITCWVCVCMWLLFFIPFCSTENCLSVACKPLHSLRFCLVCSL